MRDNGKKGIKNVQIYVKSRKVKEYGTKKKKKKMAYRADLTVPIPEQQVTNADNVGDFGIDGPDVPFVDWQPRGDGEGQPAPNRFLKGGRAPKKVGSISLKSIDFIQRAFQCPPFGDESERFVKPEMLAYIVKDFYSDDGAHTVLTISKVNQIMSEAGKDFRTFRDPNNPETFPECRDFNRYLTTYGEKILETHHQARKIPTLYDTMKKSMKPEKFADLERYYALSTQDMYCWLTAFGIRQKIEFIGSVINTNRPDGLETDDPTDNEDHYSHVNICMAKRARIANVFGPSDQITTGSKLWIQLTRKQVLENGLLVYTDFQLVPSGSATHYSPLMKESCYIDPSGRHMNVHRTLIGIGEYLFLLCTNN